MIRHVLQTSTREGDAETDSAGRLVEDEGLESFFTALLFTDARARPEELERYGKKDNRGYWADVYEDPTIVRGSKWWLFEGVVITDARLVELKTYGEEATAVAIEQRIASKLEFTIERSSDQDDAISVALDVYRPGETSPYRLTWEAYFAV